MSIYLPCPLLPFLEEKGRHGNNMRYIMPKICDNDMVRRQQEDE